MWLLMIGNELLMIKVMKLKIQKSSFMKLLRRYDWGTLKNKDKIDIKIWKEIIRFWDN